MQTRREFLKTGMLSTAGLALAGIGMPAHSFARVLGANDKVRVGVIGFSDQISYRYFQNISNVPHGFKSRKTPSFSCSPINLSDMHPFTNISLTSFLIFSLVY